MRQIRNLPVEPKMHACNRRSLESSNLLSQLGRIRQIWQQLCEGIERNGQDPKVEFLFGILDAKPETVCYGGNRLHAVAKPDRSAARHDIFLRCVIKVCQWNAWDSHPPRLRRLHRLANNLSCIRNCDAVKVFAEGAHQYWFPESLDGCGCLAMLNQPILERTPVIFRDSRHQHCQCSAQSDLVPGAQKLESQERRRDMQRRRQGRWPQH